MKGGSPVTAVAVAASPRLREQEWRCKVCRVQYRLVSLNCETFGPYFTPVAGLSHRRSCPEASGGGPRRAPKTSMGPPAEVVSRITFAGPGVGRRADSGSDEPAPARGETHASTRRGLLEACELHFFRERERELLDHPLVVDGVRPGGTYSRVFKAAVFPIHGPEEGIWFADLRTIVPIRLEGGSLVFSLQAKARTSDGIDHGYVEVRADMNGWPGSQRRSMVDMVVAVHEAAQWRNGSTPRAPRAYVLARRQPATPGLITFVDYRHLAFVLDGRER